MSGVGRNSCSIVNERQLQQLKSSSNLYLAVDFLFFCKYFFFLFVCLPTSLSLIDLLFHLDQADYHQFGKVNVTFRKHHPSTHLNTNQVLTKVCVISWISFFWYFLLHFGNINLCLYYFVIIFDRTFFHTWFF